ncbi:MAG: hypothetical protein FDZ70_10330 [Actinobacteria bacterium]|nr:MAG: hypothetical protein FDZ70_10330 [Actinomycetota bacterium]
MSSSPPPPGAGGAASPTSRTSNRLGKNLRHLRKWARREGVTCFRVYDADLPDFALAVDLYAGAGPDEGRTWAHVAEYEAPRSVDPAVAEARLDAALASLPDVLGVATEDVAVKVRRRGKGGARYGTLAETGVFHTVAEGGSLLLVNLTDHVDTGLFLDHRPLRLRVRAEAAGARFLNLFGYTGAFTVHAAAGGAAQTLTVDLSATYLDWARRNLEANGIACGDGTPHRLERADVLAWLAAGSAPGRAYDLIVCDPPAFSSSKRMEGTLDVQRDHVAPLDGCARLLAPGGTLYFSTNLRSFRMEWQPPAGFSEADITAETVPPDFARTPRIHVCRRIVRDGGERA